MHLTMLIAHPYLEDCPSGGLSAGGMSARRNPAGVMSVGRNVRRWDVRQEESNWRTVPLEGKFLQAAHRPEALEDSPPGGLSPWRTVPLEGCPPGGMSAGGYFAWRTVPLEDCPPGGLPPWRNVPLEECPPGGLSPLEDCSPGGMSAGALSPNRPHWVPISVPRSPFSVLGHRNARKVHAATI